MNSESDLNSPTVPVVPGEPAPAQSSNSSLWETVKFILLAVVIVVPIRLFIAQPFIVDGLSMYPTFNDRDYLIVDELTYRFKDPARGDVLVFQYPCPNTEVTNANDCPSTKYYIKRIIGLPGDTVITSAGKDVIIKNAAHPEGVDLPEAYIPVREQPGSYPSETVTLGADQYFVMGDNRPNSSDSRIWGVLDRKYFVGRPMLRLFPFKSISAYPGEQTEPQ